tara:strand:- start:3668 stop:4258 length:591 start_codon:yes stop_codon:yes gene_type:complete
MFLLIAVTIFAITLKPILGDMGRAAGGLIWVLVLLSSLTSLDSLFRKDYDNGTLEQLLLAEINPFFLVLVKCFIHWCSSGLVMVIVAPVIAMSLGLSQDLYGSLVLCLLVGTPAISLIGLVGSALTVALGRGGALLSLLILPIMFPVVIFGGGCIDSLVTSGVFGGGLIWLFATSMLALGVAPIATLFALRLSIEI